MDNYIQVQGLEKVFRGTGLLKRAENQVRAVDRVCFSIPKKSVFGLVGESGSGKTTLSRALLALTSPTAGRVFVDGTDLGSLKRRELRRFRRRMQIVFQDPNSALNPKLKLEKSLAEGLENLGMERSARRRRMAELLDLVGLPFSAVDRYPHEFSGGQKQRLVIARALATEPDFLILDEPVSNLDVSIQAQIINLLLDLKRELELTYLFISHDLNLVGYLSDRMAVMQRGRIVEQGGTEALLAAPRHPYTRRLFEAVPDFSGTSFLEDHGSADSPGEAGDGGDGHDEGLPEGYALQPRGGVWERGYLTVGPDHQLECYRRSGCSDRRDFIPLGDTIRSVS